MSVQPDIIWNEQCLGIRIGEQVCIYLKKHNAEYQRLQKKSKRLIFRYDRKNPRLLFSSRSTLTVHI